MNAIPKSITAGRISEDIRGRGIAPEEEVIVLRKADLFRLADEINAEAQRRGLTDEILADALKDD